jgi:hypothetical protein
MDRYVILQHDPPAGGDTGRHWDFMLEVGDVLRTWALAAEPAPGTSIDGTPLPDHRLVYLEYEGPIAGNRGHVRRWDAGTYATVGTDSDQIVVRLRGTRLAGTVTVSRDADHPDRWQFSF